MQTACWPQGKPRAELGLEKVAWSLGDCCRVVKSGKEVLGRISKCRRQVATKLMVQVGREAKVRRVGRAWK